MNTLVFEWFISLDWLENNCYHMIAIAMLRPTFTRSVYTEDDVFLNLNKTNTDSYIYNTIKSTYDQWYKCI